MLIYALFNEMNAFILGEELAGSHIRIEFHHTAIQKLELDAFSQTTFLVTHLCYTYDQF